MRVWQVIRRLSEPGRECHAYVPGYLALNFKRESRRLTSPVDDCRFHWMWGIWPAVQQVESTLVRSSPFVPLLHGGQLRRIKSSIKCCVSG